MIEVVGQRGPVPLLDLASGVTGEIMHVDAGCGTASGGESRRHADVSRTGLTFSLPTRERDQPANGSRVPGLCPRALATCSPARRAADQLFDAPNYLMARASRSGPLRAPRVEPGQPSTSSKIGSTRSWSAECGGDGRTAAVDADSRCRSSPSRSRRGRPSSVSAIPVMPLTATASASGPASDPSRGGGGDGDRTTRPAARRPSRCPISLSCWVGKGPGPRPAWRIGLRDAEPKPAPRGRCRRCPDGLPATVFGR